MEHDRETTRFSGGFRWHLPGVGTLHGADLMSSNWLSTRPATDMLRHDNQNHTHLVTPAIPGVGLAKIFLREHLDMFDRAVGGEGHHAAAELHVARGLS